MERYQAQRVRMFRCLRCRRIGNSTASIAGCDCKNARHEEAWLVPEDQLRGAVDRIAVLELALRDMADDGWADGESAMRGYIERAEGAITRAHARGR